MKRMKIGLILECGPEGADKKVCELVIRRIAAEIEVITVTLDDKPNLVQNCGRAAAQLFSDGCDRVVIVWDLHPPWRDQRPCRKEDRENIRQSLNNAGLSGASVYLVCIEEELEAWLIADGRALSAVLSRPTHPVTISHTRRVHQVRNPKAQLTKIFQQYAGTRYLDLTHAEKIIRELPDFSQLRRCETFARFVLKTTGIEI
jgi:hypothetical protein